MTASFLLYGANGYTGRLIAREAVERGLRPLLAGRNAEAVGILATELDLPHAAFALDDRSALDAALVDVPPEYPSYDPGLEQVFAPDSPAEAVRSRVGTKNRQNCPCAKPQSHSILLNRR